MALLLRAQTFLIYRLKSLTTLQRLNHTLVEHTSSFPVMESYDGIYQQNTDSVIDMSRWKRINANRVGVNRFMIPPSVWSVLRTLQEKGFQSYLVGGCVRDLLLKRIPKDFDVITTAKLKQIRRQFSRCLIVGRRFPVCMVHIKSSVVEVCSFDTVAMDSEEKEKLMLHKMPLGCDIRDFMCWRNSMHRDFTVNSLFYDPFMNQICDYANGMDDIRTLKLRTLIPAHLSFQEDSARILRGLRIAGRLGLSISKDTEVAMHKFASLIKNLARARIMMEINYMLSYGAAESTIHLLQNLNLLELFLPFHAAYLKQQFGKTSSRNSVMLMKLFSNLDKLVSCDRPCHCSLWVGLLAFHLALVTNPQDAFVIWVFASVLHHGNWKKGVKFARENATVQVKFAPEISGFSEFKSEDELSEEVSHLAALVQDSIGALVETDTLVQSMGKYPVSSPSDFVFVSKRAGNGVAQLLEDLVHNTGSYENTRKSFTIDYELLHKGDRNETRAVLGRIIMETLRGGIAKGKMEVGMEEQEVMEEDVKKLSDNYYSLRVQKDKKGNILPFDAESKNNIKKLTDNYDSLRVQKDKKWNILPYDAESMNNMPKKRKVIKIPSLSEEPVSLKDESKKTGRKHPTMVETSQLPKEERTMRKRNKKHATPQNEKCQDMSIKHKKDDVLPDKETIQQKNKSGSSNVSSDGKIKLKMEKDRGVLSKEMVKKDSPCPWPLSSLFRR